MIQIQLISISSELYKVCCEVVGEFRSSEEWALSQSSDWDAARPADLYIWDYQPGTRIPEAVSGLPSRHLFLVSRALLAAFRANVGYAGANIILQPTSRTTLASYLALAVSANRDRIQTENSLRADRDEMLQCLIQSNLRLQEYDQDRTNFLSRAIHDFRAPLTALSGYCSLLLSERLGELNQDQEEVIRRMEHSVRRLSSMTGAVFELSEGGQTTRGPELQPADIRACIDQAANEILPLAESKQIAISVDFASDPPPLFFDPRKIRQVLLDILDNACKFTRRAGNIDIRGYPFFWERRDSNGKVVFAMDRRHRTSREPNSYRIDIRNSGASIPKEQLTRIFEESTSYGGSRDRSGAGLSLAICSMILRQHNGRIWAENTAEGPSFALVLPYHHKDKAESYKKISSQESITQEVL